MTRVSDSPEFAYQVSKNGGLPFLAGSLTNPPCGQGYQWIVYHDAIDLAQDDIQKLRDMFSGPAFPDGNRRQVRPLNGRVVLTDVPRP